MSTPRQAQWRPPDEADARSQRRRRYRSLGLALATASVVVLVVATLRPIPGASFYPVRWCLLCGGSLSGVDFALNIPLFIPLGLGLHLAGVSRRRSLITVIATTVAIETLQRTVIPGRYASVDDVVSNTIGGAIGIGLASVWDPLVWPRPAVARRLAAAGAAGALGVLVLTCWLLAPSIPAHRLYGQLAPKLGQYATFPGAVLSASAGGVPLVNGRLSDPALVRQRLLHDSTYIEARIIPGDLTPAIAPIASIYSAQSEEIILLGQEGTSLVFRIRMRGADVDLRVPVVYLYQVFRAANVDWNGQPLTHALEDTLIVSGGVANGRIWARAARPGMVRANELALSPSFGWLFLLTQDYNVGRRMRQLTAVWLAALFFPTGYWTRFAARPARPRESGGSGDALRALLGAAWLGAVLVTALLLLPHAFDFPTAHWSEWVGAAAGMMLGLAGALVTGALGARAAPLPRPDA